MVSGACEPELPYNTFQLDKHVIVCWAIVPLKFSLPSTGETDAAVQSHSDSFHTRNDKKGFVRLSCIIICTAD